MNEKLSNILYEKYPSVYKKGDKSKGLANLEPFEAWGFQIKDGWFSLAEEVGELLKDTDITVVQMKEKLGSLRIDIENSDMAISKEMYHKIHEIENKSLSICEICGNAGELQEGSWLRIRCDLHR